MSEVSGSTRPRGLLELDVTSDNLCFQYGTDRDGSGLGDFRYRTKFIGIASTGFSIGQPYTFLVGTTGGPGYAQLEIDQPTNDLVYDPLRQVIYLSVPAAAPTRGNTISVLD